ncbi:mobilisation protein (MobC) [Streptococcus gallolyticus]|uniref:Mobilisation protein (MobC) n=1 Tax=Streptococcus gallolyticus TaxID=315405 RepID=A0A1H7XUC4_9STRE|nr:plasmid mobilization relaxosome protein MobC [Streptococcus gallolyticus]SEF25527.1 mobilisation protein (MobC) [Streptococcus gallolyticus]SEM37390.1 mobilisation protein (MobC) [Streptococcus gallolyticus]
MTIKRRKRINRFELRATDEEAYKLRRRITVANKKTFQAYALEMLLTGKIETYDYSELQHLRLEVNRIGQNVNQLVRYVNTFDEIDRELLKALQSEIDEMKALLIDEFKTKGRAKLNGGDKSNPD